MASNSVLNLAKDAKHDEYYTRYEDIQSELNHYERHFENKIVFCNCDDPYESNFCKFFLRNFNYLKLKRLICTSYTPSPIAGSQFTIYDYLNEVVQRGQGYVMDISEVPMENGRGVSDDDIINLLRSPKRGVKKLRDNGDFRSEECIEYLKQADIVVTNPPFSLLREYIEQLISYEKKFLIIGNPNALHYKEIFPLIKNNQIWVGYKSMSADMLFDVNEEFAQWLVANKKLGSGYKIINGEVKGRAQAIWYTNLDIEKRHEELIMYRKYSETEYLHYMNFDGIDVNKVTEIPCDYFGYMGVPDSFMDCYNPDQFEICGLSTGDTAKEIGIQKNYRGRTDLAYIKDGKPSCPFSRIIIRRRKR